MTTPIATTSQHIFGQLRLSDMLCRGLLWELHKTNVLFFVREPCHTLQNCKWLTGGFLVAHPELGQSYAPTLRMPGLLTARSSASLASQNSLSEWHVASQSRAESWAHIAKGQDRNF